MGNFCGRSEANVLMAIGVCIACMVSLLILCFELNGCTVTESNNKWTSIVPSLNQFRTNLLNSVSAYLVIVSVLMDHIVPETITCTTASGTQCIKYYTRVS